jgi:H+-transporting ATPase
LFSSVPSRWMMLFSGADIALVCSFAGFGIFMDRLPAGLVGALFVATIFFALALDQVKIMLFRRVLVD